MLYLNSELTGREWCIYSDNLAMARWLQRTVQGELNPDLADTSIQVIEASFASTNQLPHCWRETVTSDAEVIDLTWSDMGDALLMHNQPGEAYSYGVASTLVPAGEARLTINGVQAAGSTVSTHAICHRLRTSDRGERECVSVKTALSFNLRY